MAKTKKRNKKWTDKRVEKFMENLFSFFVNEKWEGEGDVRTFQSAAILTSNKGIVLQTPDGSEFQISIVEST